MFIRKLTRKKDGKTHAYWALVESYRTARGPRQRIISYLGEITPKVGLAFAWLTRTNSVSKSCLKRRSLNG
jgi:hypothetical protein